MHSLLILTSCPYTNKHLHAWAHTQTHVHTLTFLLCSIAPMSCAGCWHQRISPIIFLPGCHKTTEPGSVRPVTHPSFPSECVLCFSLKLLWLCRGVYTIKVAGVVRIDPLRFLAGCRTRQLNQALSVLSLSLGFFWRMCVVLLIRDSFSVVLF